MKKWAQKEINFLKENYEKTLNKELAKILNRNTGSIDYMAMKLGLKKDYDFLCHSKKKLKKEFTKDMFVNLYYKKNKSIREIAKELSIGKNTVDHYLKKFKIKKRDKLRAAKLRILKYPIWSKGLTKETDPRIFATAENVKITCDKRRRERLRKIEEKSGKLIKDLINDFYWNENLNQESIAKRIGLSRENVIRLMKEFDISKRPNYEYISSLKGSKHAMFGKKWEDIQGIENAKRRKKEFSLRARKNIIRRLKNNEMPFVNTKIEKKVARELIKRKLPFCQQYVVDKRFVCDFAIPEFNIIIECDGDYWHANPRIYNSRDLTKTQTNKVKRDKIKDMSLTKKEWKIFRFFEYDINKSVKDCIDNVEKEIKKQLKSIKNPFDEL